MTIAKILLGLSLAGATLGADAAVSYSATAGPNSSVSGVTTITFDDLALPAGFASYDSLAALIASPGDSGYAAQPPGITTAFFSVGTTHGQVTDSSVSFGGYGVSYFGFYMGSPDNWNSVTLYHGATQLLSLNGGQMAAAAGVAADGDQGVGFYMNFSSDVAITKVTFTATQDAFESDNHAYIAVVPEPRSHAMLLAGLVLAGGLGARARRRRR